MTLPKNSSSAIQTQPSLSRKICEFRDIDHDSDFREFMEANPTGIAIIPEKYGNLENPSHKSRAGDFAKWMKLTNSQINVSLKPANQRIVLRSGDYWLPLVFLAQDVTLPVYLNLVASYIYDRMRGTLKGENPTVRLKAEYHDKKHGVTKLFVFEGDSQALADTIKKFDINQFMDQK